MSTFVIVCTGFGAALMAAVTVHRALPVGSGGYHYRRSRWVAWTDLVSQSIMVIAILSLAVCGIIAAVIYPERAVGRTTCRNFAAETGYQTKFAILNWSDTGTCLAKAPNGKWVQNSKIIVNVPSK